jgi:transcriptional regulator with XRE-family HTH domain
VEPIIRPGPVPRPPGVPADSIGDRAVLDAFDQVPAIAGVDPAVPRVVDVAEVGPPVLAIGSRDRTAATAGVTGAAGDTRTADPRPSGGGPQVGSPADPATVTASDDGGGTGYQHRLGERLRAVRRTHGMRLQDVEERSGGRFKAVVIGSYERGDRAIATHKLAALAAFYGVPIGELLPDDGWPDPVPVTSSGIRLSVPAVQDSGDDPEAVALRRVVQHVRVLRGDHHGRVLTLRGDDLRTVAVTLGVGVDELPDWLQARGLLAPR